MYTYNTCVTMYNVLPNVIINKDVLYYVSTLYLRVKC